MHANWILWGGLVGLFAAALVGLSHTRWLQSQTLKKCVLLSVAFHAMLAIVAACVGGTRPASWGQQDEGRMTMTVVLADEPAEDSRSAVAAESTAATEVTPTDGQVETATVATEEAAAPANEVAKQSSHSDEPPTDLVPLLAAEVEPAAEPTPSSDAPKPTAAEKIAKQPRDVPAPYADRVGNRRAAAAAARGGSEETERAVQAALAWLASAQSPDGHWNAAAHGGGVERSVQGHHRSNVGAKSDHGVTGLALLAFLGAGNTHLEGGYADNVARGIRFLVDRQRSDGSLAGDAEFFAALYCHGMATIAVAEACGMTGDASLRPAVDRAVRHTLSMQSPSTGGWRYAAGDRGDTSQLGWQVMALSSARHAGVGGLEQAEARARGFLQSVSSGRAGGLAGYRPGERPSVAMTAEALVCRLFLGMPAEHPAAIEAVEMIAQSPPDAAAANAYTWYYATLASFHAGGPQWDRWNARLQAALLPLQRRGSSGLDGSWDPDPVWGGHGGRVYSTALAAMTLEVYYRHLPMHKQRAGAVAALP
jgi:hypothetical protein